MQQPEDSNSAVPNADLVQDSTAPSVFASNPLVRPLISEFHPDQTFTVAHGKDIPVDENGDPVFDPVVTTLEGKDPRDGDEALPELTVPGGSMTISESARQLFNYIAPTTKVFIRAGMVVRLNPGDRKNETILKELQPATAQSAFEKYVRFMKSVKVSAKDYGLVPTTITEALAKSYLASDEARELLPEITGLLQCPIQVEHDGRLDEVLQGYHEGTGLYVVNPQKPSQGTWQVAVDILKNLLKDFDFATESDKSRAIASFLTPALKLGGLITGPIPVDVAEADASQSGKSYRQVMVAALYNQQMATIGKSKGTGGSIDEQFAQNVFAGRPFIQLDNLRGTLDSQIIETFITARGTVSMRVLYKNAEPIDPSRFVLFISSNGFESTQDLANRSSIIRIRKHGRQFTDYDGDDILSFIQKSQDTIRGCIFAIVREWFSRGKPKTGETRHSFTEWARSLDWIVQNLFKLAPLMDGHQAASERTANPNLSFLRLIAVKLSLENQLGGELSASELAGFCSSHSIPITGLSEDTDVGEHGAKQIGKIMGTLFKGQEQIVVEDFIVARIKSSETTYLGASTGSTKYRFIRADAVTTAPPQPGVVNDLKISDSRPGLAGIQPIKPH